MLSKLKFYEKYINTIIFYKKPDNFAKPFLHDSPNGCGLSLLPNHFEISLHQFPTKLLGQTITAFL